MILIFSCEFPLFDPYFPWFVSCQYVKLLSILLQAYHFDSNLFKFLRMLSLSSVDGSKLSVSKLLKII